MSKLLDFLYGVFGIIGKVIKWIVIAAVVAVIVWAASIRLSQNTEKDELEQMVAETETVLPQGETLQWLYKNIEIADPFFRAGMIEWARQDYQNALHHIIDAANNAYNDKKYPKLDEAKIGACLGFLNLEMGRHENARKTLNTAYKTLSAELDESDTLVAMVRNALFTLDDKLDFSDNPRIKWLYDNFSVGDNNWYRGMLAWQRRDYAAAKESLEACKTTYMAKKGESSLEMAKINACLGTLYMDMGNSDGGYELLNSAFVALRDKYGETHRHTMSVSSLIILYDIAAGEYERALAAEVDLFRVMPDTEENAYLKASILNNMCLLFEGMGEYQRALDCMNAALSVFAESEEVYPIEMNILSNSANLAIQQNQFEAALDYLNHAFAVKERFNFGETETVVPLYNNLAQAAAHTGDFDTAYESANKSLQIRFDTFGENDYRTYYSYALLAEVYGFSGDNESKLKYGNIALDGYLKTIGENNSAVAVLYNNLGNAYFQSEKLDSAIAHYKKATAIQKAILLTDTLDMAQFYKNLGGAYYAAGDFVSAAENHELSRDLYAKILGENSEIVAAIEKLVEQDIAEGGAN